MIDVERLGLRQGAFALADLSFAVSAGQYAVMMGRTGAGKTSILESIAGLRPIQTGRIVLDGIDVTRLPPAARGVGYVPQDGALFPTMTVLQHLGFSLRLRRQPEFVIRQRVRELADELGITPLLDRRPAGLSGGEAQRVALGRALAFRPRILLLDEPLAALDETTREQMVQLLQRVRKQENVTVLHVTHSRAEAERLGDVIFRLEEGRVQQDRR
jgi:molybdate transport system ATP-binding protein